MQSNLIERLEAEATRRWSSVPSHVRLLLNEAAIRIADLEAQLRTERDLNAGLELDAFNHPLEVVN